MHIAPGPRRPFLLLVPVLVVLGAGCGGSTVPPGGGDGGGTDGGATCAGVAPASLDTIYPAIIAASGSGGCAKQGCHLSGMGTMTFSDEQSFYDATVNVASAEQPSLMRVAPGDLAHSYLYQKLLPTAASQMPLGGPYLDQAQVAEIEGWICNGAPPPGSGTDGGTTDGGTTDAGSGDGGSTDGGSPPFITAISPATVTAGSPAFTLSVQGGGYTQTATVVIGLVAVPTTFVDAGNVTASVDAALVADGTTLSVKVESAGAGSPTSAPATLTVDNPSPSITAIQPAQVATNGAPFTLAVAGTGFDPSSVVDLDGSPVATTFLGPTSLDASIPTITAPGSHAITVVNGTPGGGTSTPVTLTASAVAGPTITGLSPTTTASGAAFTLTITGSGYMCTGQKSQVTVGGSTYAPASCTTTQLTVSLPAMTAGTYPVTVTNPGSGMTSNALSFDVVAPNGVPTITGITPSSVVAGSGAFTLTVDGTNFVAGSAVNVDGSPRTTQLVSATQVTASLGSADDASATTHQITVTNPAPGGGTSGSVVLTVAAPSPPPAISLLTPCGTAAGATGFALTITGTNFDANATVTFGGTLLTPIMTSTTQIVVSISASLVASAPAGDAVPVVVTNPTGASSSATFGLASEAVTLTNLQTQVFSQSCATGTQCHVTGSVTAPMSLEAGKTYGNLVGVASSECAARLRVFACDPTPAMSYLAAKILNVDLCSGTQMPKSGAAVFPAADKQMILDWIAEGAPNN